VFGRHSYSVLDAQHARVEVPGSADDPLVVYCGYGPRAWMAGAVLRRRGFRHVMYLAGHMHGWRRAGLAEERQDGSEGKSEI
jgi:rhodanese-related sulfurtransferase